MTWRDGIFTVNAFVNMVRKTNADEYELTLRETETCEEINPFASSLAFFSSMRYTKAVESR